MTAPHRFSVSTHVLDTARGAPAAGIDVFLEQIAADGKAVTLGHGTTDADGRIAALLPHSIAEGLPAAGVTTFRLRFETARYLTDTAGRAFYPEVAITFAADRSDPRGHYHIPLLLGAYGYTTYRGS